MNRQTDRQQQIGGYSLAECLNSFHLKYRNIGSKYMLQWSVQKACFSSSTSLFARVRQFAEPSHKPNSYSFQPQHRSFPANNHHGNHDSYRNQRTHSNPNSFHSNRQHSYSHSHFPPTILIPILSSLIIIINLHLEEISVLYLATSAML